MGRYLPVHRHGVFHDDIRRMRGDVFAEHPYQMPALVGQHPHIDPYAVVLEHAHALAGHHGIAVQGSDDDPCDAAFHDRLRAWRRFAVMAARLKCDVQRRPGGRLRAMPQRVPLGVQSAEHLVIPLPDDPIVLDDHRADHGIGVHVSGPSLRQLDRESHVPRIVHVRLQACCAHTLSKAYKRRFMRTRKRPEMIWHHFRAYDEA